MQSSTAVITRLTQWQWHAMDGDQVVGRGEASPRSDGRVFLSIDAWQDEVFDQLAAAMLTDLPAPLYTVVDEDDRDLIANWERAGFTTCRRDWEYSVPTDPAVTGLDSHVQPADLTILDLGAAEADSLRELRQAIYDEVEATLGWQVMPAEVLPFALTPSNHVVAVQPDGYVGLIGVQTIRLPRIKLIAVRSGVHRRGIAHALLAHVLGSMHRSGITAVRAELNESNAAATALFENIGARQVSSSLELVRR
ncbi:GNAT family N-acetyltransferase [Nocardia sp. NPDC051030]|uniref:GNAT family N-acetyltransferase n=1 Tax=Nocardia sp. NPDC051030 TaxID=3155162 RepID=UPI00343C61FB